MTVSVEKKGKTFWNDNIVKRKYISSTSEKKIFKTWRNQSEVTVFTD